MIWDRDEKVAIAVRLICRSRKCQSKSPPTRGTGFLNVSVRQGMFQFFVWVSFWEVQERLCRCRGRGLYSALLLMNSRYASTGGITARSHTSKSGLNLDGAFRCHRFKVIDTSRQFHYRTLHRQPFYCRVYLLTSESCKALANEIM